MKKILMGLLSLSAISFAVVPPLTTGAASDTTIFQTGQTGKILVEGKLITDTPVVKYVVYAAETEETPYENASEVLTLTDFLLIGNSAGFQGTNPKVIVKRVNNDATTALNDTDNIVFRIAGYNNGSNNDNISNEFGVNEKSAYNPMTLLDIAKLKQLISNTGIDAYVDGIGGIILNDESRKAWVPSKNIEFVQTKQGVLEVRTKPPVYFNTWTPENSKKFEQQFAGDGVPLASNLRILVDIK